MQHGPLASKAGTAAAASQNRADNTLASKGEEASLVFDRSELPSRFGRLMWAEGEGEAVESGGASLW